jgi:hypothetical protein
LVSTDRHHGFESFEEERLLLVADFAANPIEALAQPFRLQFLTSDGAVAHTPDYLLLAESGRGWSMSALRSESGRRAR